MMSRRLLLLNLVLVTAGVVSSVQIARTFLTAPKFPVPPPHKAVQAERSPAEEGPRPSPPLNTYEIVATRNLFNPGRSEMATAAPTTGRPVLYGIVLRQGAQAAFLEDPVTKKVAGYKLGDQVAGGQVERIEADRVVIRRGDETFEVLLRDPTKSKAVAAAPTPQPSPPGGGARPPAVVPSSPAQPPSPTLFRRPQAPVTPPVGNAPSR